MTPPGEIRARAPNARLTRVTARRGALDLDVDLRAGLEGANRAALRIWRPGDEADDLLAPLRLKRRRDGGVTAGWSLDLAALTARLPPLSLGEEARALGIDLGGERRARLLWDGSGGAAAHLGARSVHLLRRKSGDASLALVRRRFVPGRLGRRTRRIGVVVDHLEAETGKTRALIDIADTLATAGHAVQLIVKWTNNGRSCFTLPEGVGFLYASGPFLVPPDGDAAWRGAADENGRLFGMVAATAFDVLIHGGPHFRGLRDAAPEDTRLIFSDHDGRRGDLIAAGRCDAAVMEALASHDAVHVVNPIIAETLRALTARPVVTIPNRIPRGCEPGESARLDTVRRFVAAGRFTRAKRMDQVVAAFARVADRLPGWTLELFGTGGRRPDVEALARTLLPPERVVFRGFEPALRADLRRGAVFVSASKYEAFGLALAEAMAEGCPVIAYDRAAGHRFLLASGAGVLVPDRRVKALAAAMLATARAIDAGDPAVTAQVARARGRVAEFAPEIVAARWGELIDALACPARRGWLARLLGRQAPSRSASSEVAAAHDRRSAASS